MQHVQNYSVIIIIKFISLLRMHIFKYTCMVLMLQSATQDDGANHNDDLFGG